MSHRIIKTTLFCILSLIAISTFTSIPAQAAIDPAAQVVYLRQSCVDNGLPLNNCFTTMSDLVDWITNIRIPQQTNPLLVEIGPGTFSGDYICANGGYVTLQGSGRQNTTIGPGAAYAIELVDSCTLDVRDLTIKGGPLGGIFHTGTGGGVTTWSNVDLISTAYGWTEGCTTGTNTSKHYWFSSRIVTSTGQGIARAYSTCGENWFLGSEITAIATAGNEAVALVTKSNETHENHVYGSVIRAIANAGVILPPAAPSIPGTVKGLVAVAGYGGTIHIHGTGIDVISTAGNQIAALIASNGAMIHANESSYNMSTGTGGKLTRILNNGGDVRAPYLWEQNSQPPSIVSANGADMAVQTNCAASGCQTTGTETHLLIYNTSCTGSGGPWFDVVTRACR
jgi:hypothetical protein